MLWCSGAGCEISVGPSRVSQDAVVDFHERLGVEHRAHRRVVGVRHLRDFVFWIDGHLWRHKNNEIVSCDVITILRTPSRRITLRNRFLFDCTVSRTGDRVTWYYNDNVHITDECAADSEYWWWATDENKSVFRRRTIHRYILYIE